MNGIKCGMEMKQLNLNILRLLLIDNILLNPGKLLLFAVGAKNVRIHSDIYGPILFKLGMIDSTELYRLILIYVTLS